MLVFVCVCSVVRLLRAFQQQASEPHLGVVQGAAPAGSENVNCVTAKEMVKKCDAKCPDNLSTDMAVRGHEVGVDSGC